MTCSGHTIAVYTAECVQDSVSHVHGMADGGGMTYLNFNDGGGLANVAVKDLTAGQELIVTFYTPISDQSTFSSCPSDGCVSSSTSTNGFTLLPINTRTGNYEYYSEDLSIPTSAGNLGFTRDYVSATTSLNSTLSPGWTHNLDTRLIFPNDPEGLPNIVLFKAHTANKYRFSINVVAGVYTYYPEAGLQATLVQNQGAPITYTLQDSSQKTYTFNEAGKLINYADAQGHTWIYSYLPDGKLDQVTAEEGKFLNVDYDAQGRIEVVRDHTNRSVSYTYGASGDLISFTDVLDQSWSYEYTDPALSHYLTRVAAPGNVTVEQQEYYPNGRAWKQYDGAGNLVVELIYNTDGTTTLKDALNHFETHAYNDRGVLITETNGVDNNIVKKYDPNFRPDMITDSLGNSTQLTWGNNGKNLTQIVDPLQNTTIITYGAYNNPTSVIDPLSHEIKYIYNDPNFPNQPTRVEYPLSFDGGVTYMGTDFEYYPPSSGAFAGKARFVTDALGNQTYYTYTTAGETQSVTTGYNTLGALTTSYSYDSLGRLTDTTDAQGIVTHNEYDSAGQLTKTIYNVHSSVTTQNYLNKYNITTENRYDIRGNQIAVIDTYGTITRTYYDLANHAVAVVKNLTGQSIDTAFPPARGISAEENIRTDMMYDDAGNMIATIDPAGVITRIYYDDADRPIVSVQNLTGQDVAVATPPSFNPAYPDQNVRTDTAYDGNGNVIASIDPLGVITRTYYDSLNRPVTAVHHLVGQTVETVTPPARGVNSNIRTDTYYDGNGNVIATVDPRGVISRTYYDALNRPITMVRNLVGQTISNPNPPDAGGSESNIRADLYYDKGGNVIAMVDPRGIITRTYYDTSNRPIATVQNLTGQSIFSTTIPDRASGGADENIRTDVAYDSSGRKDITTDPVGRVTKYVYNELGQTSQMIGNYVNGGSPQNELNQRNLTTSFEYDALGRQVMVTDTLGRVTLSAYDDLGRLLTSTQNYLAGQAQNYKDAQNNQYNLIATFAYDVRGSQIATADTTCAVTRMWYDALGRPVTAVRNFTGNIVDLTPPARGNPPSPAANLRTDTIYLGNGNADYALDEMGEQTNYIYNGAGRLIRTLDPLTKATDYQYDANGNRTLFFDANSTATRYEYDALNRLTAVVENYEEGIPADVETNVRTEYTYDPGGNRLTTRDGNSFLEGVDYRTVFTYDALGRLKIETDAEGHQWIYGYDKLGNRVSLHDANTQDTLYGYDELNRLELINYPAPDADVSFDYDALSRRLSMTDGIGTTYWTYTNIDQPGSITDPFGTGISYDYDSLGNRISLGYGSQSYSYQYNDLNQLEAVSNNQLPVASYGYDAAGRLKTITRANDVTSAYNYFDNGWLQNITHTAGATPLGSYGYQYYNDGNRSQAIENMNLPVMPPTITPTFTPTNTPTATNTATATQIPTYTATFTPTATQSPTITATNTFTPTATNTPTTLDTGWVSPTANAAETSGAGDNNGFQTTPVNAYSDNATFAVDTNSGTNTNTACNNSGKDRHVFYTYNLASIPSGSTILGIEVRLDMKVDATNGAPKSCIELSWNGGASWTAVKTTTTFTTTEATYILGNTDDTWGRAWTTSELSNLRVRITNVSTNNNRDFSLDWIPVRVSYTPIATASATPTFTQTPTNTPTATPTLTSTPTNTPTFTPTATQSGTFPANGVLDNFNRADGTLGSNWSGNTGDYSINTNQLDAGTDGGPNGIYWNTTSFGADQEAYITFTQADADGAEQDLLLKSQSSTTWGDGVIEVLYDAINDRVQVWTYEFPQGQEWLQHGADIPVTFNAGDTLGARAKADGSVEVYKNGTLLATRDVSIWPYYANGGYIGLWFIDAGDAMLDNFGGGDVSGGQGFSGEGGQSSIMIESTSSVNSFNLTSPNASPFWQGLTLGASQSSQVTFANVNGTIGKPRSNGVWDENTLQALYDVPNNRIQLWRYDLQQGWTQSGADIPVTFVNGDVFSARVHANGTVEIHKNGILLVSRTITFASLSQPVDAFKPVSFILPSLNLSPLQQSGPVTINYVYDSLYRLKEANYSNGDYYHYTYDAVGNRLSQTSFIGGLSSTTNYVYDNANRLTSVGGVTYTYDNNGNLLNDGANTYTYDSANRLKTVSNQSTVSSFQYNGLGNRLSQTVNGNTTNFTLDINSNLAQVLSDGANSYIYGLGRIAQVQGGATEYFLPDALGSARQLTDQNGSVTYSSAFDPFGAQTQSAGTTQTPYGFTGEYTTNGLIHLRAREYAPELGRFLTRDPFAGNTLYPASLHGYAYAGNNPVLYTDPSGECFDPITLFICVAAAGALIGGGANLAYQLHENNGNWGCVDWGDVAMWGGGGAVAGLTVFYALPVLAASPDTAFDLASLIYDVYTGDVASFAMDAMSLMMPGVTGLGAVNHASDALHAVNTFDNVYDTAHFANTADNYYDTAHVAGSFSPSCGVNSFSADTAVSTKDGDTPIHEIEIGDYVLAWNEETGETDWYKVTDTIHHTDEVVTEVILDGEWIETTPEHPFYVEDEGWTNAEDLQTGDKVRQADGTTGTVWLRWNVETSQEMYNLTVDKAHTFFVGDGQWLVHNTSCLIVGEGSFEYSWQLHRDKPNLNITAASYESFYDLEQMGFSLPPRERGFSRLENIDARILGNYFPANSFDAVIFNNPHIEVPGNPEWTGNLTAGLIEDFLGSAPSVLRSQGDIHINVTTSLLEKYDPVVDVLSGYSKQGKFGNSKYYAPYIARYTTGNPFPYWYPERSSSMLSFIFRP